MKYLRASLLTACILSNSLVACGGDTFESGDDASGGNNGDGDGDTGGSTGVGGTGGTTGGGGTVSGGGCSALYAYGLSVTVRGGALVEDDARDAAPPATGGGSNLILPPDPGTGGLAGTGGSMSTGGATSTDGCAAVVTATEGEYREVLECFVQAEDCQCFGAGERPGTYTVAGTLDGMVDTVTDVVVESDGCHVIGKTVTLFE